MTVSVPTVSVPTVTEVTLAEQLLVKMSEPNCERRMLAVCRSVCLSVRPSVRMEQLGSRWTDVHEI